jgi:hypothetical protein
VLTGRALFRVKKEVFLEMNLYSGYSGFVILEGLVLDERFFCKVISEIKNGMATDIH